MRVLLILTGAALLTGCAESPIHTPLVRSSDTEVQIDGRTYPVTTTYETVPGEEPKLVRRVVEVEGKLYNCTNTPCLTVISEVYKVLYAESLVREQRRLRASQPPSSGSTGKAPSSGPTGGN